MQEITIVSGKGGTGKTSLSAAFALLGGPLVAADCDVDASNLPLVLSPQVHETEVFHGSHLAAIRQDDCLRCGACLARCRFGAVRAEGGAGGEATFEIDPLLCEGCGVCAAFCPVDAIDFDEAPTGSLFTADSRAGRMAYARLKAGAENSGKLVSRVRERARELAEESHVDRILIDGPPGIGCPAIASLTGATLAVVVTEPTVAGEHDLERVLGLAKHFGVPAAVCVNKWDLNAEAAERIEAGALASGAALAGRVRYSSDVTAAQMQAKAIVEIDSETADDVRKVWSNVTTILKNGGQAR